MNKKKFLIPAVLLSAAVAFSAAGCGGGTDPDEWKLTSEIAATCGNPGVEIYQKDNGETKTVKTGEATGEHTMSGNVCSVCGYTDMSELSQEEAISQYGYYHKDEDGSRTVNTGDKIYYGSYPQKQVTDGDLTSSLNGLLNEDGWTSYGYYVENAPSDVMFWQDVTLSGTKYRAVKIDEYRPKKAESNSEDNFQVMSGLSDGGSVYWYEYSAIEWRVLDYVNGEALLNSVKNLDSQAYRNTYVKEGVVYYTDSAKTSYANDWENSDIRQWLNETFMNWAFSSEEQSKIVEKTLDNSTTSYDATQKFSKDQNNTTDKIYLLSYQDILNTDYGFPENVTSNSAASINDPAVCKVSTAYSESQGVRKSATELNADGEGYSLWMLRSAGGMSFSVCCVNKYGTVSKSQTSVFRDDDAVINATNSGISPAINIKIGK